MKRVRQKKVQGNAPQGYIWETQPIGAVGTDGLLTVRSALIFIASIIIGACAGGLAYLAAVHPAAAILPGAIIAGGTTCAAAVRFLNAIIR